MRPRPLLTTSLLTAALGGLVACNDAPPPQGVPLSQMQMPAMAQQQPAMPMPSATGNSVAGITWNVPTGWQSEGPRPMRVASYAVPAATGDAESGECAVFFFGAGQGGNVDANLMRWYGQIEQPDGTASASKAKKTVQDVNGMQVTTIEVPGTYLFSPRPMSPEKVKKPGFMLLGAIVEAPGGNVFFKLTAPTHTAEAARFGDFLQSIRKI